MDEALQLVIEMSERNWHGFKDDLKDLTPEEIHWRPLPQANNIDLIVKHLRVEEQWYVVSLEYGEQSPYQDTASVQQLTDSVPLDFERNLQELEALHQRFIAALRRTTLADLKRKTVLSQVFSGQAPTQRISCSRDGTCISPCIGGRSAPFATCTGRRAVSRGCSFRKTLHSEHSRVPTARSSRPP